MSDIAIKAEGLSKYYKLGVINNGTFFKDVQTWMARKTGKEDPNAKIGSKYDPTAEGFWALKDLNFEIKQGDRVGIIGKNGAGKSTLLKVLSRVTAPTEGDVKIKGRIASLLEVGTGFHPELTGRENIYLNGAILGMKRREVDRKIDEIIAFSEIEKHIDTPVKRYSSGMYVRLAFAVAAHLDSEILIADEVLAVGDAAFQKKALGKMNELSTGQGRTVLFVSHQMNAVKNLCNKGIVMEKGTLVRQDDNIQDSINWYLGIEEGQELTTKGWETDGSFKHPNLTPVKIEFLNQKGDCMEGCAYDEEEPVVVRVTVDVQEPNSMTDFWLPIHKDGQLVFDLRGDYCEFNQGLNTFTYTLEPKTFHAGAYTVTFGASIKNTDYILRAEDFPGKVNLLITRNKGEYYSIIKN
ncbi:MAG: ABC transporter ATP-binding protein [Treponema sp.]|nr:ABC transporter ATP-binding protein [Treponema sp.]